ncbi:MAG TPA: toll/interleukin-1 receptor domain-containing protein [Thermoanaerobaculia bacterium]|nr:toll/interleukin-1 receptor domain-containing protein [Thermoanaerobaculia bacterium]
MKVFISWSGARSQLLAQALHGWLPLVLHYVKPWLSEADVAAGERWAQAVAKELESSNFGIICVTPENLGSPWVLFEAGALAKSMQGAKVIPLLFSLEFSDISGPLAQFQAKKFERAGLGEVIHSLNQAADQPIPEDRARQLFSALWPELEKQLESVPDEAPSEKHMRPQHEILEELVTGVRGLDVRFRALEGVVSESGPRSSRRRFRHFLPMMFDEMAHMVSEEGDDPISLLMFGGLLKDDFPWLYEILIEAYREVRDGNPQDAQKAIERLRRVTRTLGRGPLMEEFFGSSKEAHMVMTELPMVLDHFLHRFEARRLKASESDVAEPDKASE